MKKHTKPPVDKETSRYLLKRLLRTYIGSHIKRLCVALFCMVIVAGATAGQAYILQPVMDGIFIKKSEELLFIIPAIVVIISVCKGIASYFQQVIMQSVGQRMVTDMQLDLYEHFLESDIAMYADNSSGKLISRFTNDIHVIRRNLTQVTVGLTREFLTLIFLVALMFYQSWQLALIGFFTFPIAVYPMRKLKMNRRTVSRTTQEEMAEYTARLDDTFQGIRIVKAYGNEKFEAARAKDVVERIYALFVRAARIESASSPIMESLSGVAIALVVMYGGYQILQGETTPGAFSSFIVAFMMAYRPMKTLSSLMTNMEDAMAAVHRVFTAMDVKPLVQDKPNAKPLELQEASITFENVSFHYPRADMPAIKNMTLEVPTGKRVALVGSSGGGKSTIMHLIQRFYDVEGGRILIDGQDIRTVTLASLRSQFAIVNQEATLYDDTIRANIAYGKRDATEEEIIAAAKAAAAHDFIIRQQDGYDTFIGQHGLKLSGGQRQRIAIARAMLRNAPILLLDEATSALDTVSEEQVQIALDNLMTGRTTLVIAHRLSTVQNADIIYVIGHGEVLEAGTHTELMIRRGAYYALQRQQQKRDMEQYGTLGVA